MRWILFFVAVPFGALADPTLECADAGSQVEIGACVREVESRVDDALTAAYGFAADAAGELDRVTGRAAALPALEAAQSAWSAYRDAQCEAVGASYGGGSGTGVAITSCRVDLGRIRVTELLELVN